jgi:hypothetical protein
MKLAMKREALEKLNRRANEMAIGAAQAAPADRGFGTVMIEKRRIGFWNSRKCFRMKVVPTVGV